MLEACRTAELQVPEEVAVVGVDNDELLCELADPPLSSVALNTEQGGYRTAELLDQLMRGKCRKPRRLVVEPLARRDSAEHRYRGLGRSMRGGRAELHSSTGRPAAADRRRRPARGRFAPGAGNPLSRCDRTYDLLGDPADSPAARKRLLLETDLPLPQVAESAGLARRAISCRSFGSKWA